MRTLGNTLLTVVSLLGVTTACSSVKSTSSCDGLPPDRDVTVSSAEACRLASKPAQPTYPGAGNEVFCPSSCAENNACTIDKAYFQAFAAANPAVDASAPDGGAPTCPQVASGQVAVHCGTFCEGRRTAGVAEQEAKTGSLGEYFATCAYLEATSVIAFERMYVELEAHRAPRELLGRVMRARAEEVRHTELTSSLARAHGEEPCLPKREPHGAVRSLFEIARENAVEGCVRETYGAALALLRASRAEDSGVREVAREIAQDEVRHAELAWDVAAWITLRLSNEERARIAGDVRDAVAELSRGDSEPARSPALAAAGMPDARERTELVALLDAHVFRRAA